MPFKFSKFVLMLTLSVFAASILVDPEDQMLHFKVPLFLLALSVWMVRVVCRMVSPGSFKTWAAVLLFGIILPGMASIIGLLGHSIPVTDPHYFQIVRSCSMLLLIPVLSSEGIDLMKHIIRWSFAVAAFTLALVVLSFNAPLIYSVVYEFTLQKDNAMFGSRDALGLGIGSFYYKTVAVLVFPLAYYLRNLLNRPKKVISGVLAAVFLAAVLCSGSRATALGAFFVIVALGFQKLKTDFGMKVALPIIFVMIALPAGYFASFFHPEESSNAAKLGHIHSYIENFSEHPTYLFWGQGADTEFYSQGFEAKTVVTELTYLEVIRWFGIPVAAIIFMALLYPVLELSRLSDALSYLAIPYVAYLWEAGTNPLLVSATGTLMVSAIWGVVLMRRAKEPIPVTAEAVN